MHTLLIIFSLLLGLVGCLLCARLLRYARSAGGRRLVQVAGLFLPAIILGLLSILMGHFISQVCFATAPPADVIVSQILMSAGATGILYAVLLNTMRALFLPGYLRANTWEAPAWLRSRVYELAEEAGLRRLPRVLVAADSRPWALVTGLHGPSLVVSSGLLSLLDREEVSAVLCHELMHLKRGDLWWTAAGGILCDLTWFLPATRRLYELQLADQEIACDDRIVGEGRRLALASALARVWWASTGPVPKARGTLALFSKEQSAPGAACIHLETRVRRLLDSPGAAMGSASRGGLLAVTLVLGMFLPAQLGLSLLAMDAMGCRLEQFLVAMAP